MAATGSREPLSSALAWRLGPVVRLDSTHQSTMPVYPRKLGQKRSELGGLTPYVSQSSRKVVFFGDAYVPVLAGVWRRRRVPDSALRSRSHFHHQGPTLLSYQHARATRNQRSNQYSCSAPRSRRPRRAQNARIRERRSKNEAHRLPPDQWILVRCGRFGSHPPPPLLPSPPSN